MPRFDIEALIETVAKFYLTSHDFHGVLRSSLPEEFQTQDPEKRSVLKLLVKTQRITFRTHDMDTNPAIKRLPDNSYRPILELVDKVDLSYLTLFPTEAEMSHRSGNVDPNRRPFTRFLEQGSAQLDYCCFDLSVLEYYRNDPRYYYKASDVEGHIFVAHDPSTLRDSDQIFLQTFGFAYDDAETRAVAVYVRYLSDLSDEHQQIWAAKLLSRGSFKLHPDYYRMSIVGDWPTHLPILDAFLLELQHVNELCVLIGKPPLFRQTFEDQKPPAFTFLFRPTTQEFNNFVHLLDKMMSDNLNKDFFKGDVAVEEEKQRADGKIEVVQIGTIRLLESWVSKKVQLPDPQPMVDALKAFREVRKLRQSPAHAVSGNVFDQSLIRQQRELVVRAYQAVRTVRLLFQNHPAAMDYVVSGPLHEGRIRTF
jgi:hypothetical protein